MAEKKKEGSSKIPPAIEKLIEKANTDGNYTKVKEALKRESESLIEVANDTFKELCRTLDSEQTKLTELETRRKRLLSEMLLLKEEIEKEKESCRMDLEQANTQVDVETMEKFDIPDNVEIEEIDVESYFDKPSVSPRSIKDEQMPVDNFSKPHTSPR